MPEYAPVDHDPARGNEAERESVKSAFPSANSPQVAPPPPPPADDGYATANAFSITEVFTLTFSCLARNPLLYLCLGICATLPGMVSQGFAGTSRAAILLASFFDLFFSVIFAGAIAFGVYQNMVGRQARLGEAISRGLARYFSLLGVSFLYFLGMALLFLIAVFVPLVGPLIAGVMGICAIPTLSVITPACAVEGIGPVNSFRRSIFLTHGHRLAIFGLFFIFGIALGVLFFVADAFSITFIPGVDVLQAILQPLRTAVLQVLVAVLYYQLRISKEGVRVDRLVSVFE